MRKFLVVAGTAVLAVTTLAGCSADSSNAAKGAGDCTPAHPNLSTVASGTLTVAAPHFPPFTEIQGTQLSGVEGQVLEEIAAMECLTLTAQSLDSGSVIPSTQNGRADIAAGNWYCTADRAKVLSLSSPVYGDQIAIISRSGADTFSELEGQVVGTPSGYLWNEEFKEIYGSDLKEYPNATALYNDLAAKRVAVAADSYGSATYANKQHGNEWTITKPAADERVASSTQTPQVCFPMSKQNEALSSAVNENLQKLRADGVISEILEENGLDGSAAEVGELRLID